VWALSLGATTVAATSILPVRATNAQPAPDPVEHAAAQASQHALLVGVVCSFSGKI
jgi:hypothetical protein